MAKRIKIIRSDDIDGSEAVDTITFALDGRTYEIDLNEQNSVALRGALEPYVKVARRVQQAGRRATGRSSGDYDAKAVRAWAVANDVDVPKRGRIPAAVVEQYHAAGF